MLILVLISVTACLAMLDITMKSVIEGYLKQGEERTAFGGRVVLRKVYNKGFCLGILKGKPEIVKYTSAYAAVVLTIYQLFTLLRRGRFGKKVGLSLLTAGAWSNTFDRWFRGYVIDYVGFEAKKEKLTRLTYNLADFFIAAGAVVTVMSGMMHGVAGGIRKLTKKA
jgi:signal peptidase II